MPRVDMLVPTARCLHAYMTYRAAREGVGHTLTIPFYKKALKKGCVNFFGVIVEDGFLVADEQQPEMFEDWVAIQDGRNIN